MKKQMTHRFLLILLILVLLSIACGDSICGRNYKITVGSRSYCCDSYTWKDSDLHLNDCSSGSPTIVNATNVSVKQYTK